MIIEKPDYSMYENYTVERIPVEALKKAAYNRKIEMSRIRKMTREFHPGIFDQIIVNEKDGEYSIIEGQHRVIMAIIMGFVTIECKVFHGLTFEQESALYVAYNKRSTRKPLNAYDLFVGNLASNDELTLKIQSVASLFGMEINHGGGNNRLACVSSIVSIAQKHGIDAFAEVLRIVKGVWHGSQDSLCAIILEGICDLITMYGDKLDHDRLISKLSYVTPVKIISEANSYPSDESKRIKMARQMLRYYNKNLEPHKRIKDNF